MALLVLGFGLGQGALFIAQTSLVAHGQLDMLGLFGGHFAFAVLGFYVVDMGTLTTMARRVVSRAPEEQIWSEFWSVSLARLLVALAICVLLGGYILLWGDDFSRAYALGVMPGLISWAFNASGILDGLRRSGLSGLVGSLPYVSSAAILPMTMALPPSQAALLLGLAFSVGMVASVVLIFVFLAGLGHRVEWVPPRADAVRCAFIDGGAMMAGWLPGQIFFRLQIVLSGMVLGPAGVGVFVYAKQIINAFAQLVIFIRRVEFPNLVSGLASSDAHPLGLTFHTMRLGLVLAALGASGVFVAALLAQLLLPPSYAPAANAVAWFAPVILSGAVFLTFPQGLIALGRFGLSARYANVTLFLGACLTLALVFQWKLPGLAVAEAIMHVFGCLIMWRAFRRLPVSVQSRTTSDAATIGGKA